MRNKIRMIAFDSFWSRISFLTFEFSNTDELVVERSVGWMLVAMPGNKSNEESNWLNQMYQESRNNTLGFTNQSHLFCER